MTKSDEDRRVRRTRRLLRVALVSLTLEKGWENVSVLDVCTRADIGRSTFYVHFADKEDLLLSAFDDLHASASSAPPTHPFAFADFLLTHAAENHDLFLAVAGQQSGQQMQWRFRDVVRTFVAAELVHLANEPAMLAMTTHYLSGGFVEMLLAWLDDPRGLSAAQVAEAFRRLAIAARDAR